jgi:paraquat-inducible protein B
VPVGSVSNIQMHFDYATKGITILVYTEFEKARVVTANVYDELVKTLGNQTQYTVMKELIGRGLRAQLEMQSFVTGQLQIALDFYPDKPMIYKGIDNSVMEIPTIPTPLQEITKKLESLPIEEILSGVNLAMDGIAKLFQSPDLKESVANLNVALKDVQSLVRNVDAQVKPLSTGLTETIRDTQKLVKNADSQVASLGANLNEAIGDGRKLIQNADGSVSSVKANLNAAINAAASALVEAEKLIKDLGDSAREDSMILYQITKTLHEVEKAARSLGTLTDYLERHPEALLGGKGDGGGK